MIKNLLTIVCLLLSVGCSSTESQQSKSSPQKEPKTAYDDTPINGRWYRQSQVDLGKKVFEENCAKCHGSNGQSVFSWKQRLADGSFPPPPLNGSAHSWHHPLSQLMGTIKAGGVARGGKMPAFNGLLSEEEIVSVIAYFQNFWRDEIYQAWIQRGGLN